MTDPCPPLWHDVPLRRLAYYFRYSAPEAIQDSTSVRPSVDFYALGCLLHHMLAGRPPFDSDNSHQLARWHLTRDAEFDPSLELEDRSLLRALMDRDPDRRLSDRDEVVERLSAGRRTPVPTRGGPSSPRPRSDQTMLLDISAGERREGFESSSDDETVREQARDRADPVEVSGTLLSDPAALKRIGRYSVRRFVSEGPFAWVFIVVDGRIEGYDVERALKLLKPEAARGDVFARFRSEAGLLARFDHPNLVRIYDFDRDPDLDCFYYTMTYVEGPSLAQLIEQSGPLSLSRAVEVMSDVLAGVSDLHAAGVVDRDIKPSNVMLREADGRALLGDLGIARAGGTSRITQRGLAIGTARYMSPEQERGLEVTAASDIFAAGATLYEALTGRNVYAAIPGLDSESEYDILGYLNQTGRTGGEIEIDMAALEVGEGVSAVIRRAAATIRQSAIRARTSCERRWAKRLARPRDPCLPTRTSIFLRTRCWEVRKGARTGQAAPSGAERCC